MESTKTQNRLSRELDERAATQRPRAWRPPSTLPDPHPRPGIVHRWIRVSMLGTNDPSNISGKFQEGWEPVKAADYPEVHSTGSGQGRFPDSVEIGGLILCAMPKEVADQREAFFRQLAESQMQSVDNSFMRQSDPRMPLFKERKSEVSFGRGSTQS